MNAAIDRLEVLMYADYICPWCYISAVRLRRVANDFGDRIRFTWKAFPIIFGNLPAMPITEHSRRDRQKASAQEPAATFIDWPADKTYVSTSMRALEAMKCAIAQNRALADKYHWALYRAFFAQGEDISEPSVLIRIAAECGLDLNRLSRDFVTGMGQPAVMADFAEAVEYWGVLTNGVPLVIIGGIPLVGAVPEESYRKVINHALAAQDAAWNMRVAN